MRQEQHPRTGGEGDDSFDWSCERYLSEGAMMPADGLDRIRRHDAVLLGAVGWPGVPDHVSLWGLLIPLRRGFRQYVNLRPVKVLDGVPSPLRNAGAGDVDLVVVRENVEGEYSEIGGRLGRGTEDELAVQEAVFTRKGVVHTMPFWDELVEKVAQRHPGVRTEKEHIDALAAKLVLAPERFDVIVGSNLFGDILSDLAAAVAGSIGVAPAANLNPEREFPSMFEPVHGSAPDIAGQGKANPLGALWSAALMLDHLGHPEASAELLAAAFGALADGISTADLGGTADTAAYTRAVLDRVTRPSGC
ncbi:isocitrate/isopropylmalate family dehydrogenase [Amycolatopsis sp. lyj-112]|uniref:isocitrate/isopropylmalate family dehydrogenase n=1 Tax=Amycolatopsis sp. lyj-112 TaxID=2789288 RepID=UPI00397D40B8